MTPAREIAPAKLNLALHVRGRLPDGRHAIDTLFAFCTDGDRLSATLADDLSLEMSGPFGQDLPTDGTNLVIRAAGALRDAAGATRGAAIRLEKNLPVASGIGGGSADAAATLRLLTALWDVDPAHAQAVAPALGSDVPVCLLSLSARGKGPGDQLTLVDLGDVSGSPILLVNPRIALSTAEVFSGWDGCDRGALGDWRTSVNDLQEPAVRIVPQIEAVLAWLNLQPGAQYVRMSGSGATCFALFADEAQRDAAADAVPREWWRLPTYLR